MLATRQEIVYVLPEFTYLFAIAAKHLFLIEFLIML